jgi:hypothetical protein
LWTISGDNITRHDLALEPDSLYGAPPGIYRVSFATLNGRRIVTAAGERGTMYIWDAADGCQLAHAQFTQGHRMSSLNDIDTRQDEPQAPIIAGGYICSLILWNPDSRKEHYLRIGSPILDVRSLPNGQVAIAGPHGIMIIQLSSHYPNPDPAAHPDNGS